MNERAGMKATPEDLIDVDALIQAYYSREPDVNDPLQQVSFGTSGHRGSALNTAFNEAHIIAITQAIIDYRTQAGITGVLYLARDTHALSHPAWVSALEVLAGAGVRVRIDARDGYTPTPALSLAILLDNRHDDGTFLTTTGAADGIVITPSHNPPADGGFKYNPPHGGPADSDVTAWIANRANELLDGGWKAVRRVGLDEALASDTTERFDYLQTYVRQLDQVVDMAAIRDAKVRIGADPLGGAAVDYWGAIGEYYDLDLTVVNAQVDPTWSFMTLDWDGKIRMDCSSPYAMASLREQMSEGAPFDIAVGNDADADRHGIVTADGGLMNPNHYLAVAINYLYQHRPKWPADCGVGKTLVSSALIDKVAANLNRRLVEVPVGFKYFVPGLLTGAIGFGGEESAGASFLRKDGSVWTTDKDGILLGLLGAEMIATTGKSPSQLHGELVEEFGASAYARIDSPASRGEKAKLASLAPADVTARDLAGDPITAKLVRAPGNDAAIGGLKVTTDQAWFAARPSGTEDVYKIYAESFRGSAHLEAVQQAAREVVSAALKD
ncbi:MAG: phosphoglucomutase (alpha-D-glucose-1,6-bisphosphate-dependent) [Bowdeniella nasicola]|nr:phosphoglucomutase (alpha-D-glucose-1,6-bisphosphate-dependent) [Bowdeniella nasicola]